MKKVIIFTDGACSGNPGPGGWAATINHEDGHEIISGHELQSTNNRMELMAVFCAIKHAKAQGYTKMVVNSDSAYVVNAVKMGWLDRWRHNGWKTRDDKLIKNCDLWKQVNALLLDKTCDIAFKKVKGHKGITFNELADTAAKAEVEKAKCEQD